MKNVYGYIRISDPKQGEGVSLFAQKEAISNYASKHNLNIIQWFEEQKTAAKQGRPLFNQMIKLIKKGKASGIVIHKIDRGARNLSDWAMIGELNDTGIEIHFAHESIDMNNNNSRLSADIQAVIAANYIRNLRQETIKGLQGRLKQGIYPFNAPVGYLDMGKGKCKAIDPIKGALVKRLFELYTSKEYSHKSLAEKANTFSLTNTKGGKMTKNNIATMLHNPFYAGLMKVKGKLYQGKHQPLISIKTYEAVQNIMSGKTNLKARKHELIFRQLIKCANCNYSLIGEKQKGFVYYRCHTKDCHTKGFRESRINAKLINLFSYLEFKDTESVLFQKLNNLKTKEESKKYEVLRKSTNLQYKNIEDKLEKLMDLLINNTIDKEAYEKKKQQLQMKKAHLEEQLNNLKSQKEQISIKADKFLELAKSLKNQYISANFDLKQKLLKTVTSNFYADGKKLLISMKSPFKELLKDTSALECPPVQTTNRKNDSKCVISAQKHSIKRDFVFQKIDGVEYIVVEPHFIFPKRKPMNQEKINNFMVSIIHLIVANLEHEL